MLNIFWSPRSKQDFDDIHDYYVDVANERVANKIVNGIIQTALLLCSHPQLGSLEPILSGYPQHFRSLLQAPNYKIVYWIEDDTVKIATIFDCRSQPERLPYLMSIRVDWVCEPQHEYGQ